MRISNIIRPVTSQVISALSLVISMVVILGPDFGTAQHNTENILDIYRIG